MGMCGRPGYVFWDLCLKQGIKFIIFCLNQGIDLSIFVLNRINVLTGYKKSQFCLKQGREISDICLKQGQGMRGRTASPHPGIYRVPPPPGGRGGHVTVTILSLYLRVSQLQTIFMLFANISSDLHHCLKAMSLVGILP